MKANVLEFKGDDGADVEIESHMEGTGRELVHEAVALIRAIMQSLKDVRAKRSTIA